MSEKKEIWNEAYEKSKMDYPYNPDRWCDDADEALADWEAAKIDRAKDRRKYGD